MPAERLSWRRADEVMTSWLRLFPAAAKFWRLRVSDLRLQGQRRISTVLVWDPSCKKGAKADIAGETWSDYRPLWTQDNQKVGKYWCPRHFFQQATDIIMIWRISIYQDLICHLKSESVNVRCIWYSQTNEAMFSGRRKISQRRFQEDKKKELFVRVTSIDNLYVP